MRDQVETPDIIKKHRLSSCPGCQKSLVLSPIIKLIKRQVFDIPVPKIQVTEHQAEVTYCDCCNKMVTALFPDKITAQVQYGEIIRSWCVYFINTNTLSLKTDCNNCLKTCMKRVQISLMRFDARNNLKDALINNLNPQWDDLYQSLC